MKREHVNKEVVFTVGLFRETGAGANKRIDLVRTFEDEKQLDAVKSAKRYADKVREIQSNTVTLTVRKVYINDVSEYEVKGKGK